VTIYFLIVLALSRTCLFVLSHPSSWFPNLPAVPCLDSPARIYLPFPAIAVFLAKNYFCQNLRMSSERRDRPRVEVLTTQERSLKIWTQSNSKVPTHSTSFLSILQRVCAPFGFPEVHNELHYCLGDKCQVIVSGSQRKLLDVLHGGKLIIVVDGVNTTVLSTNFIWFRGTRGEDLG